jgi:hypothetical protein
MMLREVFSPGLQHGEEIFLTPEGVRKNRAKRIIVLSRT